MAPPPTVSAMSDSMKDVIDKLDPVTKRLLPSTFETGMLMSLKTVHEMRANSLIQPALITRAPAQCTNEILRVVEALQGWKKPARLGHVRRVLKPSDLPHHLKAHFMNEAGARSLHTGKSNYNYILLGRKDELPYDELLKGLATVDGIRDDIFIGVVPIPLMQPTSQIQANLWSSQYWQMIYRKNSPLGPHPTVVSRTAAIIQRDANVWLALAHQVAAKARAAGMGEAVGAVIVRRIIPGSKSAKCITKPKLSDTCPVQDGQSLMDNPIGGLSEAADNQGQGSGAQSEQVADNQDQGSGLQFEHVNEQERANANANDNEWVPGDASSDEELKEGVEIVALAADARWYQQASTAGRGNTMSHAALRAISMVGQKLVRAENRPDGLDNVLDYDAFQDAPILDDEKAVFEAEHPCPDGYLCHDLELYLTHEPCVMCSMAILHSRMGRIIIDHRMPLTGGIGAERRALDDCAHQCGGGHGLGLHYRKELNWSMVGYEWIPTVEKPNEVDPHIHV